MYSELMIGLGCAAIFIALWLDKGLGFVMGGLVVSPLHEINEYVPTANEIGITLGIWATGFLIVTLLYKIAIGVEHEVEA
jgi:molybdopterin-containing oxidoreductase family membrane subunit